MAKKKAKDKRPKWFTDKLKQAIAEEKERDEEEREEDDETEELTEGSDLFDILGALCNGVALMRLAKSSLARDFVAGDEVATLEAKEPTGGDDVRILRTRLGRPAPHEADVRPRPAALRSRGDRHGDQHE